MTAAAQPDPQRTVSRHSVVRWAGACRRPMAPTRRGALSRSPPAKHVLSGPSLSLHNSNTEAGKTASSLEPLESRRTCQGVWGGGLRVQTRAGPHLSVSLGRGQLDVCSIFRSQALKSWVHFAKAPSACVLEVGNGGCGLAASPRGHPTWKGRQPLSSSAASFVIAATLVRPAGCSDLKATSTSAGGGQTLATICFSFLWSTWVLGGNLVPFTSSCMSLHPWPGRSPRANGRWGRLWPRSATWLHGSAPYCPYKARRTRLLPCPFFLITKEGLLGPSGTPRVGLGSSRSSLCPFQPSIRGISVRKSLLLRDRGADKGAAAPAGRSGRSPDVSVCKGLGCSDRRWGTPWAVGAWLLLWLWLWLSETLHTRSRARRRVCL